MAVNIMRVALSIWVMLAARRVRAMFEQRVSVISKTVGIMI